MYYSGHLSGPARWGAAALNRKRGIGLSRRLLTVLSAGAIAAGGLFTISTGAFASTAGAATPAGGSCVLSGTASFTPGLSTTSTNFSYSFGGTLSNCESNNGAPSSGTESAGEVISYNGGSYQEPPATGNGGCSNSTTSGISITKWADGSYTVVKYSTTGAAAAVSLQGSVIPSVTLNGVNGTTGTATITTNEPSTPVGASALGELTFGTTSPTDCTTGLKSASINGTIQIGSAS